MEIMDLNSLLGEMDQDGDMVNIIVSEITDAIEKQIPHMKSLLRDGDYHTLAREAHSIKGGSRNVMAEGLELSSTALEIAAKSTNFDISNRTLVSLEYEFRRFKFFAQSHSLIN